MFAVLSLAAFAIVHANRDILHAERDTIYPKSRVIASGIAAAMARLLQSLTIE
jgi:hypothetical protein